MSASKVSAIQRWVRGPWVSVTGVPAISGALVPRLSRWGRSWEGLTRGATGEREVGVLWPDPQPSRVAAAATVRATRRIRGKLARKLPRELDRLLERRPVLQREGRHAHARRDRRTVHVEATR